jgi:hypothetical protein
MAFKFRADCAADVDDLIMLIPKSKITGFKTLSLGIDGEVIATLQLTDDIQLNELRNYMYKVTDGQLMVQTVNYHDRYNGKCHYHVQTKSKTVKK